MVWSCLHPVGRHPSERDASQGPAPSLPTGRAPQRVNPEPRHRAAVTSSGCGPPRFIAPPIRRRRTWSIRRPPGSSRRCTPIQCAVVGTATLKVLVPRHLRRVHDLWRIPDRLIKPRAGAPSVHGQRHRHQQRRPRRDHALVNFTHQAQQGAAGHKPAHALQDRVGRLPDRPGQSLRRRARIAVLGQQQSRINPVQRQARGRREARCARATSAAARAGAAIVRRTSRISAVRPAGSAVAMTVDMPLSDQLALRPAVGRR